MVVPEHVQRAVHRQPRDLLAYIHAVLRRLPARLLDADVDVAQRCFSRLEEREGEDVGGTGVRKMPLVHVCDVAIGEQRDRQPGIVHVLVGEHGEHGPANQRVDAREIGGPPATGSPAGRVLDRHPPRHQALAWPAPLEAGVSAGLGAGG
jgi:hypothetical protein